MLDRCFRVCNRRDCVQHLVDAVCRDTCTRQHDRHHGHHHKRHDNHHGIVDKCHHIADLQLTGVDPLAAKPDNHHGDAVHCQHHQRHHECHDAVGKQLRAHQRIICLRKALFLMLFPAERANRHDAGENLAADQIHPVDERLHHAEFRHGERNQRAEHRQDDGNRDKNNPAHTRVRIDDLENTADRTDRGEQHHAQQDHNHHLHLLNVVGAPCDEGCRRKPVHLRAGKRQYALKHAAAQIASDTRTDPAGEQSHNNRGEHAKRRQSEHLSARRQQIPAAECAEIGAHRLVLRRDKLYGHLLQRALRHVVQLRKRLLPHPGELLTRNRAALDRRIHLTDIRMLLRRLRKQNHRTRKCPRQRFSLLTLHIGL